MRFENTKLLWDDKLDGLKQLNFPVLRSIEDLNISSQNIRLGHLAELQILQAIEGDSNFETITHNAQVIHNGITLGEMDWLGFINGEVHHCEFIYKFYLHDQSIPGKEIDRWIGPNRKDNLRLKLNKLIDKQLPLLFRSETKPILKKYGLDPHVIKQKCNFRAQLFTPPHSNISFEKLNKSCVAGHYYTLEQFVKLDFLGLYIPSKLEWLLQPHDGVNYSSNELPKIEKLLLNQRAPMVWMKSKDTALSKCFVTWW